MRINIVPTSKKEMLSFKDIPIGRVFTNGVLNWLKLGKVSLSSEGGAEYINVDFPASGEYEVLPTGTKFIIVT